MDILFTLDYELFLGSQTGSVENCLIRPLNAYLERVKKYGVKFTVFVDATYLFKLKEYSEIYPRAKDDFLKIVEHIRTLDENGHDIQLHIHPHWYFSKYDGKQWELDHKHYKLNDLSLKEAETIFSCAKDLLDQIIGKPTIAFRAGGFSAQPTHLLTHLFRLNGIKIDSSVCPGNVYNSMQQQYDYKDCPILDCYKFQDDICIENKVGEFIELPISMYKISPMFYWKYVFTRLFKMKKHRTFGDGYGIKATGESIKERLLNYTSAMATIDGFKISYLKNIFKRTSQNGVLCILGHPKLATEFSVDKMDEFCTIAKNNNANFMTISQLISERIKK